MVQLLQFYMLHEQLHLGMTNPRFTPLSLDAAVTWKYRGQVTPENKRITVEMKILDQGRDHRGVFAAAEAWLWADELRIFHVKGLKVHVVEGDAPSATRDHHITLTGPADHTDRIRQQLALLLHLHPSTVSLSDSGQTAVCEHMPLNLFPFTTTAESEGRIQFDLDDTTMDFNSIVLGLRC